MRVSPVLRATSSLLSRQTSMSFCINKAMLDPTKHIYMNHVPHNVYVDYWPMGQYPDLHLLGSVASAAYQPQVTSILLETINSRYVPLFISRMSSSPRQISSNSDGTISSRTPSRPTNQRTSSWKPSSANWPQESSLKKAGGLGSRNNKSGLIWEAAWCWNKSRRQSSNSLKPITTCWNN